MIAYRRVLGFMVITCLLLSWNGVLAAPPTQEAATLHYGETAQSRLSASNPDEYWQFSGYAGDSIMVDMRASTPNDLDTYLTLTDSQGTTLLTDDDSGEGLNARLGPFTLPATGDYKLTASRYSGAGEYIIQLINLNTVPVIKVGKPLVGVVDNTHPNDFFLLVADQESTDPEPLLSLSVTDDQRYDDPHLSLYGPSGFITSTEYEDTGIIEPLVPDPGATYVIVVSWNSASTGGAYQLSLNPSAIQLLPIGTPQLSTIDFEHPTQTHYLLGTTGQSWRITVSSDYFPPAMKVYSSDNAQTLFTSEGTAMNEISVLLTLDRNTVYIIEISDGSYQGDSGDYTIEAAPQGE
jgi:hypothetical protein